MKITVRPFERSRLGLSSAPSLREHLSFRGNIAAPARKMKGKKNDTTAPADARSLKLARATPALQLYCLAPPLLA